MEEEEVNYASVVFKANKNPTAEGKKRYLKQSHIIGMDQIVYLCLFAHSNIHCSFLCTSIFFLKYSLSFSTNQNPSKF